MKEALITPFFKLYAEGLIEKALQSIKTEPDIVYNENDDPIHHFVVNYAEATTCGTLIEACFANKALQKIINDHLFHQYKDVLELLKFEETLLSYLLFKQGTLHPKITRLLSCETPLEDELNYIPSPLRDYYKRRHQRFCHFLSFKLEKPAYANLIHDPLLQPWHLFYFPNKEVNSEEIYPNESFFHSFYPHLDEKDALFLFETKSFFFQVLQFPLALQSLLKKNHFIYILECYPNEQILSQDVPEFPLLEVLKQKKDDLHEETDLSNWFYHISKMNLFSKEEKKLGLSRINALEEKKVDSDWYDTHKKKPTKKFFLPKEEHLFQKKVATYSLGRKKRTFKNEGQKINIAHITPQLVDIGHAPSQLLREVLTHTDRSQFNPFLMITERFCVHPLEYPLPIHFSTPSLLRGLETLKKFNADSIVTSFCDPNLNLEMMAHKVAEFLDFHKIDVAVFHGPDVINTLAATFCTTPLRVLFEHGSLPKTEGFDLAILSTETSLRVHQDLLNSIGSEAHVLPFQIDLRARWEEKPFPKSALNLPPDCFAMTTISNHLDVRLGKEMLTALVEILQRVPQAVYAPIGFVHDKSKFMQFFSQYHLEDRVFFLGPKDNPSQCARSLDLYLNEFPFGSCLGMLDAMASGCPVVSMHNDEGPVQAQYAETYLGREYVISSGKREEYVNLACRLIEDREFYNLWKIHTLKQYEKRSDPKKYMEAFEQIINAHLLL